jgi:hypothetical protein
VAAVVPPVVAILVSHALPRLVSALLRMLKGLLTQMSIPQH